MVTGGHGLVTGRLEQIRLRGVSLVTGWSRVGHGSDLQDLGGSSLEHEPAPREVGDDGPTG